MLHSILDNPFLSARYFYPWPASFEEPFSVEGGDFCLSCHLRRVEGASLTVVHFHGNGETVADYVGEFEERMAALGVNLLLAEYRGYGMSTGTPALAAMLDDVELVVRSSGLEPEGIVFFGRSLGSLYAVHGAWRFPMAAGLVLESGIADPIERILMRAEPWQLGTDHEGLATAVAECLDQRRKLAAFKGRTLIMHTRNDDLVPVCHGERLYDWSNDPKELLVFPRGDHNTILEVNADDYFAALGSFLRQL